MSYQKVNRKQMDVIGHCLDDFVEPDAKCRFIVDITSSRLDLTPLYNRISDIGAEAKDPESMLATWFFAYSEGESSTRKVEQACKYDNRFIYTSGNQRPDHTTLSRFRQNNIDLLPYYFVQIVQLGIESGISDFKSISIDGSKIQASCSLKKSKNSDDLERYLNAVRREISEYMKQCDETDILESEPDNLDSVREKIKELKELEKTLAERQEQLEIRKSKLKKEHRDNHKMNITEPDATIMDHVNGKQMLPAYNVEIGTTDNQFIVTNDVVTDRNDQNQFSNIHQKTDDILDDDPEREYIADSGFHSLEQLEYIENNKVNAYVADPTPENRSTRKELPNFKELNQKEKLTRADFIYYPEIDCYRCPVGKILKPVETKKSHGKGRLLTIYACKDCKECPFLNKCLPKNNKSGIKKIHRDANEKLAENMLLKMQSEKAKNKMELRATTVEPTFGNIKSNLGFRRFSLHGLINVRGEFNLMCIAHNINKLYCFLNGIYLSFCQLFKNNYSVFCRFRLKISFLRNAYANFVYLVVLNRKVRICLDCT